MRATFLWFVGVVWLCTASAAAQRDAGVPDSGDEPAEETPEPGDTTAHQARCIQACVSAILAENMSSIRQCFNEVPECQGIGDFLPDVLTGMCRAWHDLAEECDEYASSVPGGTGGTPRAPRGAVLAAGSEPGSDEDRPRPTLDLRCFASDGTEVASVGRGWNARCPVCPTGERLFEESRYVEGRPRAPRGTTRVVAVCSATRSSAAPVIASSMESLEPRVARLESAVGGAPTREHCEGLGNVYREVMIGGNVVPVCFTPADLYLLEESEENREDVERVELNNAERDGALSRRMDALGVGRGSAAGPGSIGFRFHLWGSFGFVQLSVEDGSIIPISVGGEFDPMIALGAGWYLEGGVSLGYAIPNGTFPEALQGIYRLGFLALVGLAPEHNISIGFGGFLSERYPEVPRNGFVSDHTLIGPYGELMYVARFGDGWSFNIGVRVLVGAGFRFDGQSDRTVFDGAIMPMLGIAYWGDHARYDHSRTMCTGPHCRDTAIGRVQVVGADDEEETETEERAEETRPDPPSDGPMGRVSIVSRGDWSAIFIDDRPARVCTTPCEVDMPAGVHTLGIRRHGDGELVSYPITVIEGPNNNVIIRWRDEDDREPIVLGGNADEDEEVDDERVPYEDVILDEDEPDI